MPLGRQIRKCSLWEALICRIVSAAVMGSIVIGCVTDFGWTASLRAVLFARLLRYQLVKSLFRNLKLVEIDHLL